MKKVIASLLAAAMLAAVVAGCSSNGGTSSPAAPEESSAAESVPNESNSQESGEPKLIEDDTSLSGTVRFWIPFAGDQGMDDLIAEFNETYPNIEVKLTTYSNNTDGNTAVNTSMMSGEVDVLWSFELHNTYKRWENNMYMDLSDKIAADNIDLVENWGTDDYTYDGKIYTLPAGGRAFYVAINMDRWEQAGLGEIPTEWTWDEYLEACEKMTVKDAGGNVSVYGGSQYQAINSVMNTMYQVYGKNAMYHEDGTSSFDDPVILKALNREVKAENVDQIWFPLTTYRSDNIQAQTTYLTEQIATSVNTNLVRFIRDTETYPVDFVTAFAPFPTEEEGQDNHMEGISTFSHIGIASNCDSENFDAIYAFLKYAATYGSKYLAMAGHMPTWSGTDADALVDMMFGSEEDAAKLIDVESFKNVVCNYDGLTYVDTETTAYSEVNSLMQEYVIYAHNGEMSVEDALAELKTEADKVIAEAE